MPAPLQAAPSSDAPDDLRMVQALRSGDEQTFMVLVDRYHEPLIRLAMVYVPSRSVAEEVAQETWLAVLKGIDRFEGRSSLRTWIFRIATFQARTRGERERRQVPLSGLFDAEADGGEPSVEAERFFGPEHRWAGGWSEPPESWAGDVEARLLSGETQDVIRRALETLPHAQRLVMTMRDLHGFGSEEVCDALEISAGNQRVLLHRARSRVRAALEMYMRGEPAA